MSTLFRFLDFCRERLNLQSGLFSGAAGRRAEKRSRKSLSNKVLRIEGLEERQLLAVTAGLEQTDYSALVAATGGDQLILIRDDSANDIPLDASYERVAEDIRRINAYFDDPAYSKVKTKDYVVFFSGGVDVENNRYRYYADMVKFYATVTTELNIVPENIFILYSDGTDPAVDREDYQNSDVTFATDHGTAVYSATQTNLSEVMDILSEKMDADSHLLFNVYDHGAGTNPDDDPVGYATNYRDFVWGWSGSGTGELLLGETVATEVFKIQEGYVTCVFAECFSGGILDDIYVVSAGELNPRYTGSAHFFGMAGANHYEETWTGAAPDGSYRGFAQAFVSSLSAEGGGLLNTQESYDYSFLNNPYSAIDEEYAPNEGVYSRDEEGKHTAVEHPWAMGESFDIFGFVVDETPDYALSYVVTTLDDVVDADDGDVSLREAVLGANASVPELGGAAQITFADGLAGGVVNLTQGQLEITVPVLIDASSLGAKGITVDAAGNSRVFYITYGTGESPVVLVNMTVTGGSDDFGGGIYNAGILSLDNCLITQNVAQNDGGGIYNTGRLTMASSTLRANSSNGSAGALYNSGNVAAENVVFANNTVEGADPDRLGGAIFNQNGTLALTDVRLEANLAGRGSALASLYGDVTIGTSKFRGITNTISANNADSSAAVYLVGGAFSLEGTEVAGNVSASDGGAIYADGVDVTIINSAITRNIGAAGAGLYLSGGSLTAANSQFTRNTAVGEGGGLWISGAESVRLVNVTVAGNSTGIRSDSDLEIANSIIAVNSGDDLILSGGAAAAADAVLSSFNGWSSGKGNLIYDPSLPLFTNAEAGEYFLAEGSQAIDVGLNDLAVYPDGAEIPYDLRGLTRRSAAVVDLGAYEYQTATPPSLVVTTAKDVVDSYDGLTSLREAILYAEQYADRLGTTITFDASLAGATITLDAALGALSISSSMTIDASSIRDAENGRPGITVDAAADADDLRRVFEIEGGWSGIEVVINGLEITGGYWQSDEFETRGAGVYALGVSLTLVDSVVTGNFAAGRNASGAGVYFNGGTLTLKGTSVSGNAVSGYYTYGGGVYVLGDYVVEDSRITDNVSYAAGSENDSHAYGGGLYAAAGGTGYIANTVISANVAGYTSLEDDADYSRKGTFYAYGGGLYVMSEKLTLVNVTVAANAASADFDGFGGGIFFGNTAGEYTLANSVILSNFASVYGNDIYAQTLGLNGERQKRDAFCVISTYEDWSNVSDNAYYLYNPDFNLFAVNPEFEDGILSNADAYDLTLLPDSQIVNRGDNERALYADGSAIENDLAGGERIYASIRIDLGAYEYQEIFSEPKSIVVTTLDDVVDETDGDISLREAIAYAAELGEIQTITFSDSLAGGTILFDADRGELVITSSVTIDALSLWNSDGDAPGLTINAQNLSRIFRITYDAEDVTISGIKMVNGSYTAGTDALGGAIYAENTGTLFLANGSISGTTLIGENAYGGAVYTESNLELDAFEITGAKVMATVIGRGGAVYAKGTVSLYGSTIQENTASAYTELYGGGVYAEGDVLLDGESAVDRNTLTSSAATVFLSADQAVLAPGVTLTAEVYPDDLPLVYAWYRGRNPNEMTLIEGADGSSYTLTGDDAGCYVMVGVIREGGAAVYAMTGDYVFGVSLSVQAPVVGQTITAAVVPSDAEVTYRWYRVGGAEETLIEGAEAAEYTVTSDDVGFNLKVEAVGIGQYDGYSVFDATGTVTDFSVTLSNARPQIGETISAFMSPDGATVTYQWYRVVGSKQTAIDGAVDSSYTVTQEDAGARLLVTVTGTGDYAGNSASAQTETGIFNVELSNTTPRLGEIISANLLPSDADALYIWYRGEDLNNMTATGQFGSFYSVASADQGCYIQVVAIGSGDYTGMFASAATEVRLAEYTLSIDNINPTIGETITASLDPEDATATFQWYRVRGGSATAVEGATGASYVVTSADSGYALRVVATGRLDHDGEQTYAQTSTVGSVSVFLSNSEPEYGETLSVSWLPESMTADVQWYRLVGLDRVDIEGAVETSYTPSLDDIGYYLGVQVTGTGDYAGVVRNVFTTSAVAAEDFAITLNPAVPAVGSVVTASLNYDIEAEWQWYRVSGTSETLIEGASSAEYTVTSADIGYSLKVKAVGVGEYSDYSAEVVTSQPVAVLSVSLSEDQPVVGQTITAVLAPAAAEALYQWYRGTDPQHMLPIGGASSAEYTVTEDDLGTYLRVVAIGTGSYTGYFAMATSAETVTSPEEAPLPTGTVFPEATAYGAGIYSEGSVTVNGQSRVSNNEISGVLDFYGVGINAKEDVTLSDGSKVSGNAGSTILLGHGGGIYAKNVSAEKSEISNNSITMTINDELLGGDYLPGDPEFYGGGVYASASLSLVRTTLSGNILSVEIDLAEPDFAGYAFKLRGAGAYSARSAEVLKLSSVTGNKITIIGGVPDYDSGSACGAGLFVGSLTLGGSEVSGNKIETTKNEYFEGYGAGVYIPNGSGGSAAFKMNDSKINDNIMTTGQGYGGGLYVGSNVTITVSSAGSITAAANEIAGNSINVEYDGLGGGMYLGGKIELRGLTVRDNSIKSSASEATGAGIYSTRGDIAVYSSKIIGNTAEGQGSEAGGLYIGGEIQMANTLIADNEAKEVSAAYFAKKATIVNCTIVGSEKAVSFSTDSDIYNSIIMTDVENGEAVNAFGTVSTFANWKNRPEEEGGEGGGEPEGAVLPRPAGAEGPDDNGNILYQAGDPLFSDRGDYSLSGDSIAIGAGLVEYYTADAGPTDVVGIPRPADSNDAGAYVYAENADRIPDPYNIVVTTGADIVDPMDGLISLREAIQYAADGATIAFANEVTALTLDVVQYGSLLIDKDLSIYGRNVTISGSANVPVFQMSGSAEGGNLTVYLERLNINAGGGIVASYVDLTLSNMSITDNIVGSAQGTVISVRNGSLTLENVTLSNNTITGNQKGVGLYVESTVLTLNNVSITGNSILNADATFYGGGLGAVNSTVYISGGKISGNTINGRYAYGGGIYAESSDIVLSGVDVVDNKAAGSDSQGQARGGGICLVKGSTLVMEGGNLSGNTVSGYSAYGAGLYSEESEITISFVAVRNNNASGRSIANGGGLALVSSQAFLDHSDIGCEKQGFYGNYSIKTPGSTANSSDGDAKGGAIWASEGCAISIHDAMIQGNTASGVYTGMGGAIWLDNGSLQIYNSQISENIASATNYSSTTKGGGIYFSDGNLKLVSCTVAFNSAATLNDTRYSYGGGICASPRGSHTPNGTLTVYNSIVAINYAYSGANISRSDIWETADTIDVGNNNIIDFNPYFAETAFFNSKGVVTNPAYVGVYASVTAESRAVNTGNGDYAYYEDGSKISSALNGGRREYGYDGYGVVDIGACEFSGTPASVAHPSGIVTSLDDTIANDGVWTLREAIYYAVEDTKITFAPSLAYGYLNISDTLLIDKPIEIDFNGVTINAGETLRAIVAAEPSSLSNVNIIYGRAAFGGAVYATDLRLSDSFIGGSIADDGGAVFSIGRTELYNTDIEACAAGRAGAVYVEHGATKYGRTAEGDSGVFVFEDGKVSQCRAGKGGAFNLTSATSLFNRAVIDSNVARSETFTYGGAFYIDINAGKTVINDSYIVNNTASYVVGDVYSVGGGIYTESTDGLWLTNTVFAGNSALDGGALYSYNLAVVNILNSTIAGNTAVYGAGVYGFGTLTLENSIVALNKASTVGDDVYKGPGYLNVYLRSDIYAHNVLSTYTEWNNFADSDCKGYRYDVTKPLFAVDPKFGTTGELINGNEMNLELAADSQAIDLGRVDAKTGAVLYPDVAGNLFDGAGNPIPYAINGNKPDSAEVTRVIGKSVDLGAFEYTDAYGASVTETGVIVTTLDDVVDYADGEISLREAIALAGERLEDFKVGSLITFDESLAASEELVINLNPELGTLVVDKSLTINAAGLLSEENPYLEINAGGSAENVLRVFEIVGQEATETNDAVYITVELAGLKIAGGYLNDSFVDEEGNAVLPVGAGIYAAYANLMLTESMVAGNEIDSENRIGGAGLFAECGGTLTIKGVIVQENTAVGEIVSGAGVSVTNYETIIVEDSSIVGNTASATLDAQGAGLAVLGGELQMANSLAALNSALGTARSLGGGVFATGTVSLVNVTVGGNTAALAEANVGGGIHVTGELSAVNTIISGNYASESENVYGALDESPYNLVGVDGLFKTPALFDSTGLIANAGSANFDLAKGSAAIDAGDDGAALYADGKNILVDVVGNSRPQGDAVDIGAYEYSRLDLVVTTLADGYDWSDGLTSLREAIYLAGTPSGSLYYESTITFDGSLAGGTINVDPSLGNLLIDKDVVIDASSLYNSETGAVGMTVSGAGRSRVFMVAGPADADAISVELIALGVTGGSVDGGLSDAYGGGLFVSNAELTLTDVSVYDNRVTSRSRAYGGGIYLTDAALQVVGGKISDNTVTGAAASYGGGLYLAPDAGNVTVRDAFLTGNSAAATLPGKAGAGGAVYTDSTALLSIANTQITGNTATDGAGVASFAAANIELVNDTIAGNDAEYGGGIFAFGSVALYNTIVARNTDSTGSATSDICRSGGTLDLYADSVYSADAVLSSYTNWDVALGVNYADNTELQLFAVAETGEYFLADYSQAIDCGDNSAARYADGSTIKRDLAGNPRIEGDVVDLGAFEYVNYGVSICVDTADDVVDSQDGLTSLREAIAMATELDTVSRIYFAEEISGSTIALDSELTVTASMEIDGRESGITVSGQGECRVFVMEGTADKPINVKILGLTISDGFAASDTESTYGAGISAEFVNLTLRGCTVTDNAVSHTAGITYVYAYGGGLYASGGTVSVSGCTFTGNSATDGGGAIYVSQSIVITDSAICGNLVTGSYGCGGGIYFSTGSMTMSGVTVSGNKAEHEDFTKGGGLYLDSGDVLISDSVILGNNAAAGGGIYSFYNNSITVDSSTIADNAAGNSDGGNGFGGGIYSWGDNLTIQNTLIQGNLTNGIKAQGAGVYITYDSSVSIVNSAIVGNTVSVSANSEDLACGGGIYAYNSTMTFANVTIAGNTADSGAGLYAYGLSSTKRTTLTFRNSIIALNTTSDIEVKNAGYVSLNGSNILSGYTEWTDVEKAYTYDSAKPLFNDPASGDYSLAAGSQAVDVGNNRYIFYADGSEITEDLAGGTRVISGIVDLGAYEYDPTPYVECSIEDYSGVYDGISHTIAVEGVQDGDEVSYSVNGTDYSKNIVSFADAGEYTVYVKVEREGYYAYLGSGTVSISQAVLTISGTTVADKVYDGETTATITAGTLAGVVGGDAVVVTPSGAFPSADVGSYEVPVSYTISGDSAANYIAPVSESIVAKITPASITGIAFESAERVYSASTESITVSGALEDDTVLYSTDGVTYTVDVPEYTNVGEYTVYAKVQRANYADWTGIAVLKITPATITAIATAKDKTYDGGVTAETDVTFSGVLGLDDVTLTVYGVFDDSSAQTGKTVSLTYTLGGTQKDNYVVSGNATTTAAIGRRQLTISGTTVADKEYDGTTTAEITVGTLDNVVDGDVVTVAAAGEFPSANIGFYVVTVSYTISGDAAANYIAPPAETFSASITEIQYVQLDQPVIRTGMPGIFVSYGANRHRIQWTEVAHASGYELQYSVGGNNWISVQTNETSAVISGLKYGDLMSYRVRALGEDRYTDSEWSERKSFNVCPMDINGDGEITAADRVILAKAWLSEEGDENWDPSCDIDGNGDITGTDRAMLGQNWLKEVGDDDLVYPRPRAADAAFGSGLFDDDFLDDDLDIF